jgi:predicted dehydrogenase
VGTDDLGNRGLRLFDHGKSVQVVEKAESLRIECAHFIDCVNTGKKPLSTGRAALNVMKTLDAIDAALKSGQSVQIDPVPAAVVG